MDREYILDKLGKIDLITTFSGAEGEVIINGITGGIVYHYNPEDEKKNQEYIAVINLGNIFAKKTNLGDNCSSFNESLNKYRDFVYVMEDLEAKLMPDEKARFFERVFLLKSIEVFLKKC